MRIRPKQSEKRHENIVSFNLISSPANDRDGKHFAAIRFASIFQNFQRLKKNMLKNFQFRDDRGTPAANFRLSIAPGINPLPVLKRVNKAERLIRSYYERRVRKDRFSQLYPKIYYRRKQSWRKWRSNFSEGYNYKTFN